MNRKAFTLIEILVVVGVLALLLVSVGNIMTSSFKASRSTASMEAISSRAVYVMEEIKKNVFDAKADDIICPTGVGTSISFETKNGGSTTLLCDEGRGQVASQSAGGTYDFLTEGVVINNCGNFVRCNLGTYGEVMSIGFSLSLTVNENGVTSAAIFHTIVSPRD